MTFETLLTGYLKQRDKITDNHSNPILVANLCIVEAIRTLQKFYNLFQIKPIKEKPKEIHFFKSIKHIPFTDLIYFHELKTLEISLLHRCEEKQLKIINRKNQKLSQYFLQHIDFGHYIEADLSELDPYYFRVNPLNALHPKMTNPFMIDPDFSTPKDFEYAEFKAKMKLKRYIKVLIQKKLQNNASKTRNKPLKWKGSKIDLIELIYALHASGSLKNGTPIVEVAKACEELFEIDLGNYYRKFIELRSRKIVERTKFIDKLRTSLIKRINDADHNQLL